MPIAPAVAERLRKAVNRNRLVQTVVDLCAVPSRTGEAGGALDRLAEMLKAEGFSVQRADGGHPKAPAVIVRWPDAPSPPAGEGETLGSKTRASGVRGPAESAQSSPGSGRPESPLTPTPLPQRGEGYNAARPPRPGPVVQFNGHLDVVHLPFVAPKVDGERITGSGTCDMKGGTAAAVEALRVLRETDALPAGSILLTAHDLHEAPWGLGQQLDRLIRDGVAGDVVLIPEPMNDRLPVVGRGAATWKIAVRRKGAPVHEVMVPADEPNVIAAGAELVARLMKFRSELANRKDPGAGCETAFVGQIHSGEIYNQYPQECRLEGTRRWLPDVERGSVEREFRGLLSAVAVDTGTTIDCEYIFIRDAFRLDDTHPAVAAFRRSYKAVSGTELPTGPKMFVDDGNSFWGLQKTPAITHGPKAGGQHTVNEWVDIADLCRVAELYARTAVEVCSG